MADLQALLSQRQFGSTDEMNAFLQETLARGSVPPHKAETALKRAQAVMYEAWEAASPQERVGMAKKALAISPDCADAYVLLAEETARSLQEAADLYAKGVAAGERALGKPTFEDSVGYFWGIIETRPYMRARLGLAEVLWEMGQRPVAVDHAWDMLTLNPGDNQGVRYLLLNWLLVIGDHSQISKLLDAYPDDGAASWLYGQILHVFSTEGDSQRTGSLLAVAEKANPHVPTYLLGRKRLPRILPDMIGYGDESEAVVCAAQQIAAWRATPGALSWLTAHTSSR